MNPAPTLTPPAPTSLINSLRSIFGIGFYFSFVTSPAIGTVFNFIFPVAAQAQAHSPGFAGLGSTIYRSTVHLNSVHSFYRTVTGLTLNIRQYVALVGEVNEIGYVMNLDPGNGLLVFPVTLQ